MRASAVSIEPSEDAVEDLPVLVGERCRCVPRGSELRDAEPDLRLERCVQAAQGARFRRRRSGSGGTRSRRRRPGSSARPRATPRAMRRPRGHRGRRCGARQRRAPPTARAAFARRRCPRPPLASAPEPARCGAACAGAPPGGRAAAAPPERSGARRRTASRGRSPARRVPGGIEPLRMRSRSVSASVSDAPTGSAGSGSPITARRVRDPVLSAMYRGRRSSATRRRRARPRTEAHRRG